MIFVDSAKAAILLEWFENATRYIAVSDLEPLERDLAIEVYSAAGRAVPPYLQTLADREFRE